MKDLKQHIYATEAGSVRCFIGADYDTARRLLHQSTTSKESQLVLMKRLDAIPAAETLIDDLMRSLADTALRMWPVWYTDVDFSELGRSRLDRTMIRFRLRGLSARVPGQSAAWTRNAIGQALSGRLPLPGGFARETQLRQLALAISPRGLNLVIGLEEAEHNDSDLASLVNVAEWLARQAQLSIAILLPRRLADHPALERIMFNAVVASPPIELTPEPDVHTTSGAGADLPVAGTEHEDVWLWPVLGKPHPNSPGEWKLAEALMADADLAGLFRHNQRVETIYKSTPIVDLLWEEGRVVVEIDGTFHAQPRQYAADRHRDFQLLVTGYLVLRLPHDEVMRDTAHAIEKIRKVVEYRRGTQSNMERRT